MENQNNRTNKIMKHTTRILFAVLTLLALLALALPARAEIGTETIGITNSLGAAYTTTANLGSAVKVANQDNIGLLFKFQGSTTGTSNIVITVARSVDGTTFETSPPITWTVPANGTTAVVAYTNLGTANIGAAGYIKVTSIQNLNITTATTNCSLTVIKKNIAR
jgi:hypothetical protein